MRLKYYQRETRELVNLDSCDLIQSQFGLVSDYQTTVALDYFAEISEQMLPSAEPNERFFRLLLAVLDSLREGGGAVFFVSNDRTGTMAIDGSVLRHNPNDGFATAGLPGIFFLGAQRPTITASTLSS